jgi:hypothetical protein
MQFFIKLHIKYIKLMLNLTWTFNYSNFHLFIQIYWPNIDFLSSWSLFFYIYNKLIIFSLSFTQYKKELKLFFYYDSLSFKSM